jgi:hypothetical protein
MAGPWEKYQNDEQGPWSQYAGSDEQNIKARLEQVNKEMWPSRFASSFVDQFDPTEILKNPDMLKQFGQQLLSHPIDTIARMYGSAGAKAYQQAKSGDYAGAAGTLLGGYGPMAATALKPRIPIVPGPLSRPVLNQAQKEAVAFGKANDVPMSLGVQTGRSSVQGAEGLMRNIPGAGGVYDKARLAGREKIQGVISDLAESVAPSGATSQVLAGEAISGNFARKINSYKAEADSAYASLRQIASQNPETVSLGQRTIPATPAVPGSMAKVENITASMPGAVDVTELKAFVAPIVDRIEGTFLNNLNEQEKAAMRMALKTKSPGYAALKQIQEYPHNFMPLDAADSNLSVIKSIARNTGEDPSIQAAMRDQSQGLGAAVIPKYQEAINNTVARMGSGAVDALNRGRQATIKKYELASILDELGKEPFTKLTQKSETGVRLVKAVKNEVPEALPDVARATIEEIIQKNTKEGVLSGAGARRDFARLPNDTKAILFGSKANEIGKALDLADMMRIDANPSGSGRMVALGGIGTMAAQNIWQGDLLGLAGLGAGMLTARELAKKLYWGQPIQATIPRVASGAAEAYRAMTAGAKEEKK